MRRFFCNFRERGSTIDRPETGLSYVAQRWSATKIGGPDLAEIAVSGPLDLLHEALRLLGDRVRIYNEEGVARWFGYVHEVEINYGATMVSVSLETVANRVAVPYTDASASGSSVRKTTGWAEDEDSIEKFGVKEVRPSFEGTDEEAEAFRDAELLRRAWPVPVVRSQAGSRMAGGTGILHCRGPWHKLSWQYWQNLAGLEEYTDDGAGEVTIGASYTATTIAFDDPDDITDSAGGLGSLKEGDSIWIAGATNAANNSDPDTNPGLTIKSEGASAIEISENTVVDEAAGASVTISRNGPRVDRVAQSFTLSHNTDPWLVNTIAVRALKAGSPAGDITLELCSDGAGEPGAVLETANVEGGTLAEEMDWVEFELTATTQLSFGVTYWIVVRKATPNLANYYQVDLNEDAGYASGVCLTHNGTLWSLRSPACDMPFRVVGAQGTLGQVRDIVEANDEFGGSSVVIVDTSDIKTEQYREGDGLASDEVEDLIAMGRSTGESLVVEVTENRKVIIRAQPSGSGSLIYRAKRDGLIEVSGSVLAPGETIAAQWIQPDDLAILDIFKPATALFVESSEYDANSDRLNFETDGALSVYKGRRVLRG